MGREMDWGTLEYRAPFTLIVRAMPIKYRDGEGKKRGREMAAYTLHSTLIAHMNRERLLNTEMMGGWEAGLEDEMERHKQLGKRETWRKEEGGR